MDAGRGGDVLPDLLLPGLTTVFCGSAASRVAALKGAYYAGPGNKFWPTLHAIGLTAHVFPAEDYPRLLELGIGLTDLAKHHSGSDSVLPRDADDVDALLDRLAEMRPKLVAFTAMRPAKVVWRSVFGAAPEGYGRQSRQLAGAVVHVLPSPSGLARRWWRIEPWHALARDHDAVAASGPFSNSSL